MKSHLTSFSNEGMRYKHSKLFFENAEYFEYQSLIPGMRNYVSLELTNEK